VTCYGFLLEYTDYQDILPEFHHYKHLPLVHSTLLHPAHSLVHHLQSQTNHNSFYNLH